MVLMYLYCRILFVEFGLCKYILKGRVNMFNAIVGIVSLSNFLRDHIGFVVAAVILVVAINLVAAL